MLDHKNPPFIHLFTTPGGYYVYDVNTNCILMVSKTIFQYLSNIKDLSLMADELSVLNKIISDGFLSSNKVKEIEHPQTNDIEYMLCNNIQTITLQLTQQCNLRCEYCAYSGNYSNRSHSAKAMDFELAQKGINLLVHHTCDVPMLNIGFYGGEPLLEFELLKKCVEYAKKVSDGKKMTFNVTTNGTLFTDDNIKFLEENEFSVLISIDGSKENHDKNRKFAANGKGTFDVIVRNISHIKNNHPRLYKKIFFNAVIDPTLDYTCSNEFFSNTDIFEGTQVNTSLISSEYQDNSVSISDEYWITYEKEIFKTFLLKIGRINEKNPSRLGDGYFNNLLQVMHKQRSVSRELPERFHPSGPCIPGVRKLMMTVDGDFYPCEKTSELSEALRIGSIEKGFDKERIKSLLNIGKITESKCKNCWAFRLCTICPISADDITRLSPEKKMAKCNDVIFSAEQMLKNYCALKEFGYKFDDSFKNPIYLYEGVIQ